MGFVSFITAQPYDVRTIESIYGPMVVFHASTLYHLIIIFADVYEGIEMLVMCIEMLAMYILSSGCLRLSPYSQLCFMQYSAYPFLLW